MPTRLAAERCQQIERVTTIDLALVLSNQEIGLPLPTYSGVRLAEIIRTLTSSHVVRRGHGNCSLCLRERIGLWCLRINPNGNRIATLRCIVCARELRTIGAAKITDQHDRLPLWEDKTSNEPCARCESTNGVEWHHWAPRHLFDDYHRWPLSPLCRKCHEEWHRVVTPNMSSRKPAA